MSLRSFLVLVLAGISLAAPSPSLLKVSVVPAATSARSKDISLNATVTNPTSEDIKFIKFGSILDTLPTRSFVVTKDGKEVNFTGIRVLPDVENEDSWSIVPAGQSVTVTHNIGFNYDFFSAGTGKYTFASINNFHFGPTSSEVAAVQSAVVEIDVIEVEALASVEKTTPVCSNEGNKKFIAAALSEARALAGGAATDIKRHPNSTPFKNYFGNSNRNGVWYLFDRVAGDLASSGTRQLHCSDPNGFCAQSSGAVAYTALVLSEGKIVESDIYVCKTFYSYPITHKGVCDGRLVNTRGGVLLHELTHAVDATTDIYGCNNVRTIPDKKQAHNADNYACFASQIHKDYNC